MITFGDDTPQGPAVGETVCLRLGRRTWGWRETSAPFPPQGHRVFTRGAKESQRHGGRASQSR